MRAIRLIPTRRDFTGCWWCRDLVAVGFMHYKLIFLTVVAAIAFVLPIIPYHQRGDLHIVYWQCGVVALYGISVLLLLIIRRLKK